MNNQYKTLTSSKPLIVVIVVLAALLAVSGCTTNRFGMSDQDRPGNTAQSSIHRNAIMEYRIGPADVLSISVWNHREMNQTVTVRPDGNISFPLTGDIQVSGLTPKELQGVMEQALGKYM